MGEKLYICCVDGSLSEITFGKRLKEFPARKSRWELSFLIAKGDKRVNVGA
jgi:hypothetical protein